MTANARPNILRQILATKADEVARRAVDRPLSRLRAAVEQLSPPRGFINAIENSIDDGRVAVIAEIKKASPSEGVIRADFAPADLARDFAEHGAVCLSVLTDETWFQGHDRYLAEAREACALPILRKDFVIDPYQIFEARQLGADAVLLIVAALGDPSLHELAELAHALGLDVLVEVHDKNELVRALQLPCRLIGINNRNLHTFETHLDTTLNLCTSIPPNRIVVTESGLSQRAEVAQMRQHNVNAFLTGTALMRAANPGKELQTLFDL